MAVDAFAKELRTILHGPLKANVVECLRVDQSTVTVEMVMVGPTFA